MDCVGIRLKSQSHGISTGSTLVRHLCGTAFQSILLRRTPLQYATGSLRVHRMCLRAAASATSRWMSAAWKRVDEQFQCVGKILKVDRNDVGELSTAVVSLWYRIKSSKPVSPTLNEKKMMSSYSAKFPSLFLFSPWSLSTPPNWLTISYFRWLLFDR